MTQFRQPQDQQRQTPESAEEDAQEGQNPAQPATEGVPEQEAGEMPEAGTREAALEAELEETRDRLLRTLADMENLRRRTAREMEDARKYAVTGFARDLLEVADNLSRALESVPPDAKEELELIRNLAEGVAMTEKSLLATFDRHQIAKVQPELGEKFDHNRHQAMFEIETGQQPSGTVAQVLQPGYVIADRLLRPAMVGVAKAPADRTGDGQDEPGEPPANDNPRSARGGRPGEHVDTTA